jgi:hypothetical protein
MAMPAKPTVPAQPADVGHAGHDAGVPAPPPAEKGMSGGHEGMRMEDGKRP